MIHGLDRMVKTGLEMFVDRKDRVVVILDILGGVVEVVERMVVSLRHHYSELYFVIPDRAMSEGTVFAMAGDKIFMNYFSCLGPIDPQIQKDGKLVPTLAYLVQYKRQCVKAEAGALNTAEFTLFEQARLGRTSSIRTSTRTFPRSLN
jgi:membrane-bound ClpP family serine protease